MRVDAAAAALTAGQSRILEMIATGLPLGDILPAIVDLIESAAPEMLASVELLDEDGVHLRHGAARRLPAAYCRLIDGLPIGPRAGSCGTAMHRRETVIVENIARDPLWADYREAAAAYGLRACWSTPILDPRRQVLGSFALYFSKPGRPAKRHLRLIELATHLAAIAIAKSRADSERQRLTRELGRREGMFRSVFENSAVGVSVTDMRGTLLSCNPALTRMLGYSEAELAGRQFSEFTHPQDVEPNLRLYRALAAGDIDHFQMQKRYLRKDGAPVWVQLNVSRVPAEGDEPQFTIGVMEDITARKQAEESLRESEQRFRTLAEFSPDAILIHQDMRIVFVNRAMVGLMRARDAHELIGKPSTFMLAPQFAEQARRRSAALYAGAPQPRAEQVYVRLDGTPVDVEIAAAPIMLDGRPAAHVTVRDNTERKRYESRIEYLATHDGLTALPNRNLIHDRITQAISHARRTERQIAVMYIDLDRFKVINDGLGHPFGDAVLKAAGERLAGVVREGDTIARQGGDEFLVLLADLRKSTDVYIVAQKILEAFEPPFLLQEREIHLTASIGVSLFPQDGETADVLIGNADVAMYRAKDGGRNAYQFFTREMSDETRRRVEIETELRAAVSRGQLHLAYQPKVDLASGRIAGCEALLRWSHPSLGPVPPARFIPIAEDSGLIVPLGDWVLRAACAQNKAWQDAGLPPIVVSVNLSPRQFLQQDVVAWVMRVLEETGLPPGRLELELTESLLTQDIEKAIATVNRLKQAGVRLAIDDFGIGYSSLSHLKRFRVDTLKIDQSFVRNLTSEVDDATIALAVIALAHNMRMTAVAEGVETEAQCRFLRLNRCDAMQGHFFSKPVPAAEMAAMLKSARTLGG